MNVDPAGDVLSLREHIGVAAEAVAQLEIDADRLTGDQWLTSIFANVRQALISAGDRLEANR